MVTLCPPSPDQIMVNGHLPIHCPIVSLSAVVSHIGLARSGHFALSVHAVK